MKPFRIIIPIVVVSLAAWVYYVLVANPPEVKRFTAPPNILSVEATRLQPADYQVRVTSQGTVRARTESTLIPRVSGPILSIAPAFRNGGFFEEGDLLAQIDPADYESAVVVAKATLKQAEAALEIERAQSEQARENWKKLGQGDPSPLVLREPQLAEAAANAASAKARLDLAQRDLERTRIIAPYSGRVLTNQVDVGQFVSPGTPLARVFAVDYVEVRLPLTDEQAALVDLPESYRGEEGIQGNRPQVKLTATVGGESVSWTGDIVRAEGTIDLRSRQLFVVAQVEDPYGRKQGGKAPLRVGTFVEAEIVGKTLQDVFLIPRGAVRDGHEVLLIDDANKFRRHEIHIVWGTRDYVVTKGNLKPGDLLCTTAVPFAVEGGQVIPNIEGEGVRRLEGQGGGGPPGGGKPGGPGKPGGAGKPGAPASTEGGKPAGKGGKPS